MTDKLARDESGMAMALAVIMVALLSVMGAGLLVFVNTDLNAVVETNQGQRAFEMADAGVNVARHELGTSSTAGKYNGDTGGSDPVDSQWSLCSGKMPAACATSPAPGVTLEDLDYDTATSDSVNVTIRQIAVNTFKVVSTGEYGSARRRIEALYKMGTTDLPLAVYGEKLVKIECPVAGAGCPEPTRISGVSLFSGGKVEKLHADTFEDVDDVAFGNWQQPPWNTNARDTARAGAGAVGEIEYSGGSGGRYGTRDFDRNASGSRSYKFQTKNPPDGSQDSDVLSFPFDPYKREDLSVLKNRADPSCSLFNTADLSSTDRSERRFYIDDWPDNSTEETVCFVDFSGFGGGGGNPYLKYDVPAEPDAADAPRGILVVINGGFENLGSGYGKRFHGAILLRNPFDRGNFEYQDSAGFVLRGFVHAEGDVEPKGRIEALSSEELARYPEYRSEPELQSWREVYNLR